MGRFEFPEPTLKRENPTFISELVDCECGSQVPVFLDLRCSCGRLQTTSHTYHSCFSPLCNRGLLVEVDLGPERCSCGSPSFDVHDITTLGCSGEHHLWRCLGCGDVLSFEVERQRCSVSRS